MGVANAEIRVLRPADLETESLAGLRRNVLIGKGALEMFARLFPDSAPSEGFATTAMDGMRVRQNPNRGRGTVYGEAQHFSETGHVILRRPDTTGDAPEASLMFSLVNVSGNPLMRFAKRHFPKLGEGKLDFPSKRYVFLGALAMTEEFEADALEGLAADRVTELDLMVAAALSVPGRKGTRLSCYPYAPLDPSSEKGEVTLTNELISLGLWIERRETKEVMLPGWRGKVNKEHWTGSVETAQQSLLQKSGAAEALEAHNIVLPIQC